MGKHAYSAAGRRMRTWRRTGAVAATVAAGIAVAVSSVGAAPANVAGRSAEAAAVPLAVGLAVPAAATQAPPKSVGHDISHPQCNPAVLPRGGLPRDGLFAIVGVGGGKAFTANPCLATQWTWAVERPHRPGVYVNTGNPGPRSAFWPAGGATEHGARCGANAKVTDPGCAYLYGARAAEHAMAVADAAGVPVDGHTWWLDVETMNSWEGDGHADTASLQGMYDRLLDSGVDEVGIYSTTLQWGQITGGYHAGSADAYRDAWEPRFTPGHRMEKAPLWIAGVDRSAAVGNCGDSFTGAPARLAQYIENDLDHNLVCAGARGR